MSYEPAMDHEMREEMLANGDSWEEAIRLFPLSVRELLLLELSNKAMEVPQ
jgi:hypothetical protein